MKRIFLIIALVFVLSTGKIVAQEQERVIDSSEIEMFLALSKTIRSGEITFVVNDERKDKSVARSNEYKITFFKTGELIDIDKVVFRYNLLDVADSMQYIYDGEIFYVINHKKKTYSIDIMLYDYSAGKDYTIDPERKTCGSIGYKRYIFPFIYPPELVNELFWFYIREDWRGAFYRIENIKEMQKRGSSTVVTMETSRVSPDWYPNWGDDFLPDWENANYVLFTEEYEWDISKSLLLRYSSTVKDDSGYSQKTIVKTETLLIDASLNNEKHLDTALYNGLNHAKSYKIKCSDYKNHLK